MEELVLKEETIFKAALHLFVKNGFHGTPTSRIAREAGVSNGTLFHYFPTKDILINRLYLNIKKSMISHTLEGIEQADSVKSKLELVWSNLMKWTSLHTEEYFFIQQFTFSPFLNQVTKDTVEDQKKVYEELISEGKRQGIIKDLPNELLYIITNSTLTGYIQYMKNSGVALSKNNSRAGFQLLWDAIKQ